MKTLEFAFEINWPLPHNRKNIKAQSCNSNYRRPWIQNFFKKFWSIGEMVTRAVVLAVRRGVCSRRSLKMNWSFSPCSSLWVMPKVEWWSHFSPRDSNLWKVSLMMISWNCNITLMNEMSNMAAPKAHLSSFPSYFPGNHSRKINKAGSSILNGILMIYSLFFATFLNVKYGSAKSASFFFFSGKSQ